MGICISKNKSQEKISPFSELTSIQIEASKHFIDAMYALHNKNISNLNHSCDLFTPNISYGIIVDILTPKSFIILCPLVCERENNKYKLFKFIIHLKNVIVPEINSNDENEKQAFLKVSEIIHDSLFGTRIMINNVSMDNEGKILCDLVFTSSNRSVSKFIVDSKLGISSKSKLPNNWLNYIGNNNIS